MLDCLCSSLDWLGTLVVSWIISGPKLYLYPKTFEASAGRPEARTSRGPLGPVITWPADCGLSALAWVGTFEVRMFSQICLR